MTYPEYQADLDRTYESEVMGEVLFAAAARLTLSAERREKWRRLQDLETQTKDRLLAYLATHQQGASLPAFIMAKGRLLGAVLALLPWSVSMKLLGDGTAPFLAVFERLERNADASTKGFFSYVVAHERAIAEFARRERSGQRAQSIAPVTTLLA
jgi:hypothetical protein